MNTGQMLMVIGALALLSLVSLTINTMMVGKTTTMLEAEASLNAISIAQTMIDEIMTKSYDASTVSVKVYNASGFTAWNSLGCNSSEASNVLIPDVPPYKSIKYYNDVDDYHRYRRIVSTPRMGNFTVTDTVYYVSETNPDLKVSANTFHKK